MSLLVQKCLLALQWITCEDTAFTFRYNISNLKLKRNYSSQELWLIPLFVVKTDKVVAIPLS